MASSGFPAAADTTTCQALVPLAVRNGICMCRICLRCGSRFVCQLLSPSLMRSQNSARIIWSLYWPVPEVKAKGSNTGEVRTALVMS